MTASSDIDIVKTVFERRLHQADLDRILAQLSRTDREELVLKMGDLLDRISALVDVSNKVSDTLSLNVLLPRLMDVVTTALHADRSTLFLHDEENKELFSRVAQGDGTGEIRIPDSAGIAGHVFTSAKNLIIPDAYADPRFNPEVDKKTGYRTRNILCAIIKNKGKVIGLTQVLNKKSGDFDEDDMSLLSALTAQAASALQNAHLFEKVEKSRREEAQLLEVTSAIAAELNLDILLKKIIGVTTDMLGADRATLFIHDPKTDTLWSRIAMGLESKEIRIPAAAGIAGACFTSGNAINIPDAYADPRFNQAIDKKTGYRTRNILCMPVVHKDGRKLGVIQVLNRKAGPFNSIDEKRLQSFGAQAAIALDNAQLFEDVTNEKNYNESILRSLSNGVITLDAEGKIIKANAAALKILDWKLEEVVEKPAADLFPGEKNAWIIESIKKVVETGKTDISMDVEVTLLKGDPISANFSIVPLIDVKEEAIGYMIIIDDISSEKRVKSTMARYMTKEVAEKLLEGGEDALGGTQQLGSVLFSDIRSFTTISEALGARETVAMLNEYFTYMIDVVFRHKGILDKYIGDAIMAIFGSPFPGPDDADNAVATANEMMKALRILNLGRMGAGHQEIKIGIGVNTGELVSGNIGSPKRMDYTVIGDTVNLAARLEGATKVYGVPVLLSEYTVKLMRSPGQTRELDLIRVKGKTKPVGIYEALDHHDDNSFPNIKDVLGYFDEGLRSYRAQEWTKSIASLKKALKAHPGDAPSQLYIKRCGVYIDYPPAKNWDGSFTMISK